MPLSNPTLWDSMRMGFKPLQFPIPRPWESFIPISLKENQRLSSGSLGRQTVPGMCQWDPTDIRGPCHKALSPFSWLQTSGLFCPGYPCTVVGNRSHCRPCPASSALKAQLPGSGDTSNPVCTFRGNEAPNQLWVSMSRLAEHTNLIYPLHFSRQQSRVEHCRS